MVFGKFKNLTKDNNTRKRPNSTHIALLQKKRSFTIWSLVGLMSTRRRRAWSPILTFWFTPRQLIIFKLLHELPEFSRICTFSLSEYCWRVCPTTNRYDHISQHTSMIPHNESRSTTIETKWDPTRFECGCGVRFRFQCNSVRSTLNWFVWMRRFWSLKMYSYEQQRFSSYRRKQAKWTQAFWKNEPKFCIARC